MIQSREILPLSLRHAMLSNRVLGVLAQMRNNQQPSEKQETLSEAVTFLDTVRKGKAFTKNLELREDSYQAALAYGEAIRAIEMLPPNRTEGRDIEALIDTLISNARSIRDQNVPDQVAVSMLTDFFAVVRDVAMSARPRIVERVVFGD